MRVEVIFRRGKSEERKVVEVRAPSVADGLVHARVLLYNELDDRKKYLEWGIVSVRKVSD